MFERETERREGEEREREREIKGGGSKKCRIAKTGKSPSVCVHV